MSSLLLLPLLPWLATLWLSLRRDAGRNESVAVAAAVPLLAAILLMPHVGSVLQGGLVQQSLAWLPQLGLEYALRLDGLALLFVGLIIGIGLMIIIYARGYLSEKDSARRFHALLLLFMGAMLGVVTSDNLLILVVFWELTSLSSFLLIGYWSGQGQSRRGARLALAITGSGGLALLAGVLLIGRIVGSFALEDVLAAGELLQAHPHYPWLLALVLAGVFSKSAQWPLHFWLPHAMAAPTPVSAYLHSATMVKVGIFLLARLHPALAGPDAWFWAVSGAGAVTMLSAAAIALTRNDLKALLAYSTVSHLGLMTLLLGLGTPTALAAALFHLFNHALFKAPLFMLAGIVDHSTGTRDLRRLGGLASAMPWTLSLTLLPAAAMAGLPFLSGYLSKRAFLGEMFEAPQAAALLVPLAAIAGALAVGYSLRFVHGVFFGPRAEGKLPHQPHDPPAIMWAPVLVFALACMAVGLAPDLLATPLIAAAVGAVLGADKAPGSLAVSGMDSSFWISLGTLGGGIAVYVVLRRRLEDYRPRLPDARLLAERLLRAMITGARAVVGYLENGSLQRYMVFLIAMASLALLGGMLVDTAWRGPLPVGPLDLATTTGLLVLAATALATARLHRHRLLALLLMGASGLLVTLVFARFSAPDLALTQLSVEVMAVVILMLALSFLPQRSPRESTQLRRARDIFVAVAAGAAIALPVFAILTQPQQTISDYFIESSLPLTGGHNVVNVILVDFRAFDTLGEITVLAIAALAIFMMTVTLQLSERVAPRHDSHADSAAHPLFLKAVSRPVLPLALLVAAYIFLRGHNLPGGGFIAGLIAAAGMTLQYMANGLEWAHRRRRTFFRPVVAAGLLIACGTALGGLLFGAPLLTSWFGHFELPLIGDLELTTAMAFDLGVFLTVVGSTLLVLSNLGKLMTLHGPGQEHG